MLTKALTSGHQVSMVVATVPGQEPVQAMADQVRIPTDPHCGYGRLRSSSLAIQRDRIWPVRSPAYVPS